MNEWIIKPYLLFPQFMTLDLVAYIDMVNTPLLPNNKYTFKLLKKE